MDDEWGVAYRFDRDGTPASIEDADDEQDARAWAYASGDPTARVVHRREHADAWEVA